MAYFQPHIVDHAHRPETRRIAGAKVAVHIGQSQAGIGQRTLSRLGMDLRHRFVGRLPGGVFINPGDARLALDTHPILLLPLNKASRRTLARARFPGLSTRYYYRSAGAETTNSCYSLLLFESPAALLRSVQCFAIAPYGEVPSADEVRCDWRVGASGGVMLCDCTLRGVPRAGNNSRYPVAAR